MNWARPRGSVDYRVTAGFWSPDILNGGQHRAVDAGDGQGRPAPVFAPMRCRARGLHHFDGALGVEFDLGGGYYLQLWHLSGTLAVESKPGTSSAGRWRDVLRGQQVGVTGNTGANLPDGRPMPHHTHIVMLYGGRPIDPAPYLFGKALNVEERMSRFKDVKPGSTHEGDIERAAELGLLRGISATEFGGGKPLTREQAASVVVRLYDLLKRELK